LRHPAEADRRVLKVDREVERQMHRVRSALAKELAAVASIRSCAEAATAMPDSAPPELKAMAERIARRTSRLIARVL
jgi:phage-related minor tail protein